MKIFDGVPVNPATMSPAWQGVLGVAMLLANSFIEADKIRDQRVAREQTQRQEPTTLSDVIEQSGLKIPHLHDALTAFMGGSEEAKDAATLIVNAPDPVKLLRDFAKMYTPGSAANGPIVTPPPAAAPARPMPGSPAPSATSSKGVAPSARPKRAAFRPEFTHEGLEATERATTAGPRPKPPAFRHEFTREGLEAAARAAATPAPATSPSVPTRSLVDTLAERLAVLTQQMQAYQQELDTRIRCAEAELAALCEELENLRVSSDRPILFVVPSIDEAEAPPVAESPSSDDDPPFEIDGENDATVQPEALLAASEGPALTEPAPAEPVTTADSDDPVAAEAHVNDAAPPVEDAAPPLPSATSDADLARAFSMLGDFTDQAAAHYASEAERVRALERKISHMRGLVESARGPAVGHG